MIVRSGMVSLDGRDLAEWFAVVTPGLVGDQGAVSRPIETKGMPFREGAMLVRRTPSTTGRQFDIPVAIERDSHDALMDTLDELGHFAERGSHRLVFAHEPSRYWRVVLTRDSIESLRPRFRSKIATGTLVFVSGSAYAYDLEPFTVAIINATERVPIPLGTGDVAPVFRVSGGNQQEIIHRDAGGVVVARMRLDVDLTSSPNDFLTIDNQDETVFRSFGGTSIVPADDLLQGSYLTLSPRYGDRRAGAWGTLELTSGRCEVRGRRTWTR